MTIDIVAKVIFQNKFNFYGTYFLPQIAVPDEDGNAFNYDLQRQHIVFCGTEILQGKAQSGQYCKAIVIRTGQSVGLTKRPKLSR